MSKLTLALTSVTTVRYAKEEADPVQGPKEDGLANWRQRHWLISNTDYGEGCADNQTKENYRQKMIMLFGDNNLPAIVYKGETVPARTL